ncbi:MAG: hypothetical protein QOJ43_445 [Gaiellaceae bacterium]|jgi:hypothetical protein|nr:hypothetical protein [Gaiellaceae bacterium]
MDEFTITIPRERGFGAVAGLVVGGVAARHEVTLDVLDDLQLALDALLDQNVEDDGEISVILRVADGTIEAAVGPLPAATASDFEHDGAAGIGLKRLLETVVDSVSLSERDGGSWVELRKGYAMAGSGS